MDPVETLARIQATQWGWTTAEVDRTMAALGFRMTSADAERRRYLDAAGVSALARVEPNRLVASVCIVWSQSREPAELDEATWDTEVARLDAAFSKQVRAAGQRLGPPVFEGLPRRGPGWESWAPRIALWSSPSAAVMLQFRQDDTDVPIALTVTWCPVERALVPSTTPSSAPARAAMGATPPTEPEIRALCARAVAEAERGALDASIELLRGATALNPLLGYPWLDLGKVLAKRGDANGALECLDEALAADARLLEAVVPARVNVLRAAGGLRGRYDALVGMEKSGVASPEDTYELAWILKLQGHEALSRVQLARFADRAPAEYAELVTRLRDWLAKQPLGL